MNGRARIVAVYAATAAFLLPLLWIVLSAFRPQQDLLADPFGIPGRLTMANFRELVRIPSVAGSAVNSVVVAGGTALLVIIIAVPLGYVVSRYSFPGSGLMRTIASAGYLLAPAVLVFPYTELLSELGLMDTRFGIILAHSAFAMPFAFGIAEIGMRGVPLSLEEAAMIDGASPVQRVTRVVLPLLRFHLVGLFALIFCVSWKEYFYAFAIAQTAESVTLPVLLANLHGGDALSWNLVCALSALLLLPAVPILLLTRSPRLRELARGRMA